MVLGMLTLPAGRADGRAQPTSERCCFQLSVQASGSQTVNYGDGTGSYPYYRGKYSATWNFAFRALAKDLHHRGHDHIQPIARYGFRTASRPQVALHDWTAAWSFQDTPAGVQGACCYTQIPHGWQPACSTSNAVLDSQGFSEDRKPSPYFYLVGHGLVAGMADLPARASFQCGLNDGRLDVPLADVFDSTSEFPGPSTKQLLYGSDYSRSCSLSVSFGGDGGISIVGSSGTVRMRVRLIYFPPSRLYKMAKRLDSLTGESAPGFKAPPAKPNTGPHCAAG